MLAPPLTTKVFLFTRKPYSFKNLSDMVNLDLLLLIVDDPFLYTTYDIFYALFCFIQASTGVPWLYSSLGCTHFPIDEVLTKMATNLQGSIPHVKGSGHYW